MTTLLGNSGRWGGPWNCPYCEYKSTRKYNMRLHIDRRHANGYNPFYDFPKDRNPNLQQRVSLKDSRGFLVRTSPSLNSPPDPDNSLERALWIQNLSKELEKMSDLELACLLPVIRKRLSGQSF